MKKRLVSKFLMGALVVLTMGVFSSCKDYDDDINANTAMINDLQSQVDILKQARQNLENELATAKQNITNLQNGMTDAVNRIAAAETALAKAQEDIKTAQATADQAKLDAAAADAKAAQAIIDAANAQITADAAKLAAEQAHAAALEVREELLNKLAEQTQTLNAAIALKLDEAKFNEILQTLATKEGLNEALTPVINDIATLRQQLADNAAADATLKQQVEAISDKLDQVFNDYVKKADFESLKSAVALLGTQIESVDAKYNGLIENLTSRIQNEENTRAAAILALETAINQIKTNYATLEYVDGQIGTINDQIGEILEKMATKEDLYEAVGILITMIDNKADQDALEQAVTELTAAIAEKADNAEFQQVKTTLSNIAGIVGEIYADYVKGEDLTALKTELQTWVNGLGFQTEDDVNALIDANNILIETKIAAAVDPLTNLVTGLGTKVSTLEGNYASLLETVGSLASQEYVDGKINEITNTMGAINTVVNNTLVPQVNDIDGRVTSIENELGALQTSLNEIVNDILADFELPATSRFGANASANSNTLASVLKMMAQNISDLGAYIRGVEAELNAELNVLTAFVNKNVTSLVTKPSYWTYGFPTIDATIIEPQSTYTFTSSGANATYTETANASNEQSGYAFELTAKYWVNPSCVTKAKLQNEYTYSFDEVAAKNYITRGSQDNQKAGVKDVRFYSYSNGVLTVKFKFDQGENVNDALTLEDENAKLYAWTTTLALRATRTNTADENDLGLKDNRIVTSDYAIVAPNYLNNLVLGNIKYKGSHKKEGNQKYHLWTNYDEAKAEDAKGIYSFELDLDDTEGIDFNEYVNVHYNDCNKTWTNEAAQEKGFEFKYTLLVNDDVWNLDGSKITIGNNAGVAANTGNDKAAIVRVELIANGKTYAYGYLTVLMKNKQTELEVDIPKLVLKCQYDEQGAQIPFTGTYSWSEFMAAIKTALGDKDVDWTLANFVVAEGGTAAAEGPNAGPYKKFVNANENSEEDTEHLGTLSHVGDNLQWAFTEDEAVQAFYDEDGVTPLNTKDYATIIKIVPNDKGEAQGVAPIIITVKIGEVVYPEASFGFDQRILSYWFKEQTDDVTENPEERYEVHGSVEVFGQANANDEFDYDFSATFRQNKFTVTAAEGYDYSNNTVSAFFDASKYYVLPEGIAAGDEMTGYPETSLAKGASGAVYLLYLTSADDNVLHAVKRSSGTFTYKKSQPVVVLSGDDATKKIQNFIASYQKYTYFDGNNKKDYSYAYDLLNAASHKKLQGDPATKKVTFTTHMILRITDYCLPVKYTNEGNRFDIRYLRPISIDNLDDYTVYDAVDGAYDENGNLTYNSQTMIYLADIVKFVDWRDTHFKVDANGMKYVNYYGIKAIHPNFEDAMCDLDGSFELISDVTDKLKFSDETIGVSELRAGRTAEEFRNEIGYFLYENNSSVVETFHIQLPITIEYHWGETAAENITITVVRTKANARVK